MQKTPSLELPLLTAAQAQKHVTVNESFIRLDKVAQLVVQSRTLQNPPNDPENGDCYIVPQNSAEAWGYGAQMIACFTDGTWERIVPRDGWRAWSIEDEALIIFANDVWSELSTGNAQSGAETFNQLTSIGIQTDADDTNRLSLKSPASLFDYEDRDHRLNINKQSDSDNCSIIFQTQYTGHAEFGLTGSNDFQINVSPDGQNFKTAIQLTQAGDVSFPQGVNAARLVSGVTDAGGVDTVLGLPNYSTVVSSRTTFPFAENILYFSAFYVDRPTQYLGGVCAVTNAATQAGSILRAGLYELGQAQGNGWNAGAKLADLGTNRADETGHRSFELDTPLTLQAGWYLHAIGTNTDGVSVRALECMTPGTYLFTQFGSSHSSDFRITGMGRYLFSNSHPELFGGPLPQNFPSVLKDRVAATYSSQLFLVPKWNRWM